MVLWMEMDGYSGNTTGRACVRRAARHTLSYKNSTGMKHYRNETSLQSHCALLVDPLPQLQYIVITNLEALRLT